MKKTLTKNFKIRLGICAMILTLTLGGGLYFLFNTGLTDVPFIPKAPNQGQIKIACVGDSVTYGYGLRNWNETNYPAVLQRKLGSSYHVMNFGISGHCAQSTSDQPYILSDVYQMSLSYDADIVVFMLGSNDSKVDNWQGKEHFRSEYCKLLDDYKNSKIILCTPPTAFYIDQYGEVTRDDEDGITNFEIQPKIIEEIAEIVKEVAIERNLQVVDINTLTHDHPEWFSVDGTHPNEDGANAIAMAIYDMIN